MGKDRVVATPGHVVLHVYYSLVDIKFREQTRAKFWFHSQGYVHCPDTSAG